MPDDGIPVVRRRKLLSHIERLKGMRVLVVGDFMLDKYVWGTVNRVSPEAPVPVVSIDREEFRPGGAGNVAANVSALGGIPLVVGVRGCDPEGEILLEVLRERGAVVEGLMETHGRCTTVKCRVIAQSHHLVRMDREVTDPLSPREEDGVLARVQESLAQADAVILEDYNKGVLTPRVISTVVGWARQRGVVVAVDPKLENFMAYKHVTLLKPNQQEVERVLGVGRLSEDLLVKLCSALRRRMRAKLLLVTRGERGMALFGPGSSVTLLGSKAREVYDVSGAGDTVVSVMAMALAAGARPWEAAYLANAAAGICVSKVGTQPVNAEELLRDVHNDRALR